MKKFKPKLKELHLGSEPDNEGPEPEAAGLEAVGGDWAQCGH